MPRYKVNNETYNIPEKGIAFFLKEFPSASLIDEGVDPYHKGTKKEDLISRLTPEQAELVRTDDVKRLQHQAGQSGIYGNKVTVEEFAGRNPEWTKKFESKYGKFDPKKHTEIFQKEYNQHVKDLAYQKAINAKYPEAEAKKMADDWVEVMGFQAGYTKGDPRGQDKKFGEFTSSRLEPQWKPFEEIKTPKDTSKTPTETPGKTPEEDISRDDFQRNPPPPLGPQGEAPWWLQDIIKVAGAVGDKARIKRYMPWQATPQVRLPEATFYDPTRELAANAEQANISAQAAASFTDPRQLAAQMSAAQGQAGKNAADIMSRYNNLNVGLANQLSQERTNILNQASQNKANLDTQLWDKYTVLNQQFDNSKAQARQNIRQSYMDAITNRANTANLNTLYPQYAVDPSTGGLINFTGDPNQFKANKNYSQADMTSMYNDAFKLTGDSDRAIKLLQLQMKGSLPNEQDGLENLNRGYQG